MGRYAVVEAPDRQPAVDYVTGSGVGPFIDTGRDITFGDRKIGRIYLSKSTVREMAQEFGLIGQALPEDEKDRIYRRGKQDATKENLHADLRDVVAILRRVADSLDGGAPVVAPDPAAAPGE